MIPDGNMIIPVENSIGKTKDGRNISIVRKHKKEGVAIDIDATSEFAKKQKEMAVKVTNPSNDGIYHHQMILSRIH